jgi:enamine deaminase RidA (YjgF/YER057c/UK114 family)
MAIDVINSPAAKPLYDGFHFSQAVAAGELVLLSGQLGSGADGRIPAALGDEFRNAWKAIGDILALRGLGFADIVEYTTFHVGLGATLPTFMKVRDEFLSEPWPAWTAIGVSELAVPQAHVEIRVTARKPG